MSKKITLRCHHDADGIVTAYFTSFGVDNAEIEIWDGDFGDTTGLKPGDYMLDMRPIQNMEGLICIDHHLPHIENRKYTLISDVVPASLIAYNLYKENIPKSEHWKLSIGLVGDGAGHLIPPNIFKQCPELLTPIKTGAYSRYGRWSISQQPTYRLLSSAINSLLRTRRFDKALRELKYSKSPMSLIHSLDIKAAKAEIRTEFDNIMKECDIFEFPNLSVILFYSDLRMSGYLATKLLESVGTPAILAINRKTNKGSLRGDLALYWQDKLSKLSQYIEISGHPGFMGATLKANADAFIEELTKLLIV